MGFVRDIGLKVIAAIPVLITKIATFLLLIFTIGLFAGYALALTGLPYYYFLIPIVAMGVMWYKLDEGFLFLVFILVIAVFYSKELGI